MDPRYNRQEPQRNHSQHHRFSWQTPPETPPEHAEQTAHSQQHRQYGQYQQYNQQLQQQQQPLQPQQHHQQNQQTPTRIHTDVEGHHPHNRTFSYAQTPAEHIAFQYIPSPSDAPPLPQMPSPTPIDQRPASYYIPHQQTQSQPPPIGASPPYEENPVVSPLLGQQQNRISQLSPISPVTVPEQTYAQQDRSQRTQHARNLSNLSPINTNLTQYNLPPVPTEPQPKASMNHPPVTPISPSSIKKEPLDHLPPTSPTSKASYAHQPYSPHGLSSSMNTRHAVFSPDSAHGPNGLDFSLHRPGQIAHPNMDLSGTGTKQSWKTSLCSCTPDVSTCLTGLFCPCIIYGRTSYRLTQKSDKKDPTNLLNHSATNGHCIVMALSCGFWWLYPMLQRTRLRHMYKLEGDCVGDCVKGVCCCCCVAVQNEREVKIREEATQRWAGPASSDVYGREAGLKYAPQS